MRIKAIRPVVLLIACVALAPFAFAEDITGPAEATGNAVDTGTLEKPAPKIEAGPSNTKKPTSLKTGHIGAPSTSKPKFDASAKRNVALDAASTAQEQVELSRPSVHRQKVMRVDNLPRPKVRPIAVIYGALGPYGYQDRYLAGQAGTSLRQKDKQGSNNANSSKTGPGGKPSPQNAASLKASGAARRNEKRGR